MRDLNWSRWIGKIGLVILAFSRIIADEKPIIAQIVPDDTLGSEKTVLNSHETIKGIPSERISGGAARGTNLFHSFLEFNVKDGQAVYFDNPADIKNIFSRVTGNNLSEILGKLGVLGGANLFLINPNGIIFGPNATLDVQGSFVATTANGIQFGDRGFFSATAPNIPTLLTVNPSALFFNQITTAPIENQSIAPARLSPTQVPISGLRVPDGQSLVLVGGEINLNGGRIQARGGRVELAGVRGTGVIGLNVNNNNLNLSFPEQVQRANVSLNNGAEVNVRAGGGGSITINAQNLNMTGGSFLRAGIEEGLGSSEAKAGDIDINATGIVNLQQSVISHAVRDQSIGQGGDINISTGSLFVNGDQNNTQIHTLSRGQGDAGNITITSDLVFLDEGTIFSYLGTEDSPQAVGQGGQINITTGSLILTNGGNLSSRTYAQGNGGDVRIVAHDRISLDGVNNTVTPSRILTTVQDPGIGNAGSIYITANFLSLTNGAEISSFVQGQGNPGNPGNVNITAGETIFFDNGSRIFTTSLSEGNSGNINITTGSLYLSNGARLRADTFTGGNGGNITLLVEDTITLLNNSQISTNAGTAEAGGDGGNIEIDTNFVITSPLENSDITANAYQGRGGKIELTAQGLFGLEFRDNNTFLSDITASSQLGIEGIVSFKIPEVDPTRGLVKLPTEIVNLAGLIDSNFCQTGRASEFTLTGRGGLPPVPLEILRDDTMGLTELGTPVPSVSHLSENPPVSPSINSTSAEIIEAQGWIVAENEKVILTAHRSTVIAEGRGHGSAPLTNRAGGRRLKAHCY